MTTCMADSFRPVHHVGNHYEYAKMTIPRLYILESSLSVYDLRNKFSDRSCVLKIYMLITVLVPIVF